MKLSDNAFLFLASFLASLPSNPNSNKFTAIQPPPLQNLNSSKVVPWKCVRKLRSSLLKKCQNNFYVEFFEVVQRIRLYFYTSFLLFLRCCKNDDSSSIHTEFSHFTVPNIPWNIHREITYVRVSFLTKLQNLQPYQWREPDTGVFLSVLRNFWEHLLWWTPANGCFWDYCLVIHSIFFRFKFFF